MNDALQYLIIIIMLAFAAFFAGAEISFNSVNKLRLKKSAEAGEKGAKLAYSISENFAASLSAILIGNNLANTAATSCATTLIIGYLVSANIKSDFLESFLPTFIMTLIVLIFCEIVPKIVFKENSDNAVKYFSVPVKIFTIILFPISIIVISVVSLFRFIWGKDQKEDAPTVTGDELSTIIDTVEEEGIIDEDKSELLQSTLEFPDTTVQEIMTPRIDVTFIDIDDDWESKFKIISDSKFSRIPVYENSIDNIIGILYLNHFYKAATDDIDAEENREFDIRPLLIPPCFIHKTMRLPDALSVMREKKMHLAVIIDEFGGTMGIVTMEDILEELVGDIWDESDDIIREIIQTGETTYEVIGDMNIDDFFGKIDVTVTDFESEYSTVGGWAVEMLDSDPHVGDSFNFHNLYIIVTEMLDMRITKLSVLVNKQETDGEDE